MNRYYSHEDLTRWEKAYGSSVTLHLEKLSTHGLNAQKQDFHLGMLQLSYETEGLIHIAKNRYEAAIKSFKDSKETLCKMYERYENGLGRPLEAGHFQSVLIGFVTSYKALIAKLANHYSANEGTKDSCYLGRALKLITAGNLDDAKAALAEKKPRFETEFIGFDDCFAAIVNRDEQQLLSAIKIATKSWEKCASNRDRGLPFSVCFIKGIGIIRLAEHVLGKQVLIDNQYMPHELLR